MAAAGSRSWNLHLTSLLPVNLVQAAMAFVGLAVYSRLMHPAAFGEYVLATTAQLLGQFIAFGWLSMAIPRFTASCEREGTSATLLVTALGLFLLSTLVLGLGLAGLHFRESSDYASLIQATALAGIARGGALIGLEAHRAGLRITRYSLLEAFQSIASVVLAGLFLTRLDGRPESIFLAIALVNGLVLAFDALWWARQWQRGRFSSAMAGLLWGYGGPLVVSTLFCFGLAYLDRFLLAHLTDRSVVGAYGAALSLGERPLTIGFIWVASASSSLAFHTLEQGRDEEVGMVMQRALVTLIMLTFPMATGLMVLARPISTVMLGQGFHDEVGALLPYVAWLAILKGLVDHYLSQFFQLGLRTRQLSLIYALALSLSLGANLLLVPRLGALGTLASAGLAYGFSFLVMARFARRRYSIGMPWRETGRVVLACLVMYGIVNGSHPMATVPGLVLSVCLGAGVYGLLAFLLDLGEWRSRLVRRHA